MMAPPLPNPLLHLQWKRGRTFAPFTLFALAACAFVFSANAAQQYSKVQLDFFESKIRPILANSCYKCHSTDSEKVKGGLYVDSRDALLKGGNTGPAIVPGNLEKSLLIKAVSYTDPDLQMPPKNQKLTDQQIEDLKAWVKMGAPDPRTATASSAKAKDWGAGKTHWAFQPIVKTAVPTVTDSSWAVSPVDSFVLAKLEEKGMKPSPPAEKRTLIRRAYFDLTGLPPTPKEVDDFVADATSEAFAKVVDRLLASPQYGERWGRYWLDVARYADTKGEVKRKQEGPDYPFAWTYRDYVVKAFNDDKPYDRFIVEQIAADMMPNNTDRNSLAALGFITLGDRFMNNQNDIINDRIDVVTKGFLGLTVSCARCHDHKFDPIPTRDYYSLRGVFISSEEPKEKPFISKPINPADYNDYLKKITALDSDLQTTETQLKAMRNAKDGNGKQARKKLQNHQGEVEGEIGRLEMTHPGAPARAMVLVDKPKPEDSPVFIRGEADSKGPIVPRQFLEILSGSRRQPFHYGSGRLELAYAIASRANPMTPRVMVNRIWQHHFGEGFVTTPDDLGNQSAPPSHPELLDYLAARFMQDGWSVKKIHRLIMLSNTYQQSSDGNPRYAQIDPNNRLLWRANIRRLEFEAVRDSILAIGGKLDKTVGGKPVDLLSYPINTRRTIYGFIDRANLPEMFNHFDFANPDTETGKRYDTIVPQQSLFFMNSPLVVEEAKSLVHRADFQKIEDDEERVEYLYKLIVQRPPTPDELKLAGNFLAVDPSTERVAVTPVAANPRGRPMGQLAAAAGKKGKNPNAPKIVVPASERRPLSAWEEYAQALMLTNEMSFVN